MSKPAHIILFDGVCNLCNRAVQYVIRRDKQEFFRFASLQSDIGRQLLIRYGLQPDDLKTFVYLDGDKAYIKSEAALKVAARLSYPAKILSWLIVIPKRLRDIVYNIIARNRYRVFGKTATCMMPDPQLQRRFL